MPTAWTAYAQGDVMSPPGPGPVVEQLMTSAYERLRAAFGDSWASVSGRSARPVPAAGDPFLFSHLWGEPGGPVDNGFGYVAIDNALFYPGAAGYNSGGFSAYPGNALGRFIDHTRAIEGAAARPPYWTLPTIRSAASLPLTKFYYTTGGAPVEIAGARGTLMKRVRYRMISGVSPGRDTQGNAATTGQRAFALDGTRYRYDGATWQRDESAQADLIDNTQDPPDTVCEFAGVSPPAAGPTFWGAPQIGDCALLHLFEERRLVLDLMRWTMLAPPDPGETSTRAPEIGSLNGSSNSGSSGGSDVTDVAAEAAAAAAYAGNAPSVGPTFPAAANGLTRTRFASGEEWGASLSRSQSDFTATQPPGFTLSALAKKYAFYSLAGPLGVSAGNLTYIFDAQGDPVANGTYHQWDAGGPIAGTPTSAVLGNAAASPPNYTDPAMPPPPGALPTQNQTSQGYQVNDAILICKWNVAGGLSWCSVTD